MTLAVSRTFRRPFWMTPFGTEGWRDHFSDRLWPELLRDKMRIWPQISTLAKRMENTSLMQNSLA